MNTENHSSIITNLILFLESCFQKKLVLYFKNPNADGFVFPNLNAFVARDTLPKHYRAQMPRSVQTLELRLFCGVEKVVQTKDIGTFFHFLDKKQKTPIFFVTPYFDGVNVPEEPAYACSCPFEVRVQLCGAKITYTLHGYNQSAVGQKKIREVVEFLRKHTKWDSASERAPHFEFVFPQQELLNRAENTIEHMLAGDCYLANLTHALILTQTRKFVRIQDFVSTWLRIQSQFGFYYCDEDVGLSCFSPERFLFSQKDLLLTEPIKGTLPIHAPLAKRKDAQVLWKKKKEIYEHTLVVDLLRHDLHGVCEPGSVLVYHPFFIKTCYRLLQMQSSILGLRKKNLKNGACLAKMLPAGSVTGTPKKKVCEIIQQQEMGPRGFYTGVSGVMEPSGDFDSCVLIRSIYLGERGVYCGVGAGVTALSSAQEEIAEFEIKLHSFLNFFL